MSKLSDKELIDLLKSVDQKDKNVAFNYIYDTQYKGIALYIIKNSGSETNAKDVFQDALIIFYEKVVADQFELTGTIQNYISIVVRNIWLKQLKGKYKTLPLDLSYENISNDEIEPNLDDIEKPSLKELMGRLSEGCKRILTLFYYDRLSMTQIAEKLSLSTESVARNKKARCIKNLRSIYKDIIGKSNF